MIDALLSSHGVSKFKMAKSSEWVNTAKGDTAIQILCYRAWVRFVDDIEKRFSTRYYMAITSSSQFKCMLEGRRYWFGEEGG